VSEFGLAVKKSTMAEPGKGQSNQSLTHDKKTPRHYGALGIKAGPENSAVTKLFVVGSGWRRLATLLPYWQKANPATASALFADECFAQKVGG
jgi:hypothetical protein